MHHTSALLGLYTQTSLHAGAGSSAGVIDLPIQREGHSGWPCIFGSGVKGALRAHANQQGVAREQIQAVFGPDTQNAAEHGGAIMVGDARLVLLPVRSLTTYFKWVTCPAALQRLKMDATRLGLGKFWDYLVPEMPDNEVAWTPVSGETLFLEEYRFGTEVKNLSPLIDVLARLMKRTDAKDALQRQLVVISDDRFSDLVQQATPVTAHTRLDSDTKTVTPGALWYEETLPPETLMTVALTAVSARRKDLGMSAQKVLQTVLDTFPASRPWLQVGGNETVGMGWCEICAVQDGD
jgi:CRISPR-associated protein Cmr4